MNKLIDIHSHILNDLDDGVDTLDKSVETCKLAVEEGISDIIATPHLFHPFFNVDYQKAERRIIQLKKRLSKDSVKLNIHLGFECRINGKLIETLLASHEYTLCGNSKFFLLEFDSRFIPPPDFNTFLFEAKLQGLQPILVHPERYYSTLKGISIFEEFVEKGIQIQVTASAFTGFEGKEICQFVEKLLKANIIHYVASDFHNLKSGYQLRDAYEKVCELSGNENADKLFITNPGKIIGIEERGIVKC